MSVKYLVLLFIFSACSAPQPYGNAQRAPTNHNSAAQKLLQLKLSGLNMKVSHEVLSLLDNGADVAACNAAGQTFLHRVAACGDGSSSVLVTAFLLNDGAPINSRDNHGRTAMHLAIDSGNRPVAKQLIESGADLHVKDMFDRLPAHYAALTGDDDLIKLLREHEAFDLTSKDALGQSVLDYLDQTLAPMAYVNHVDKNGNTPLHLATDVDGVEALIARGADVNSRNSRGKTPLHTAASAAIALTLIENKAEVNAKDKDGRTPLHDAVHKDDEDLAKILLLRDADPNLAGEFMIPPLATAQSVKMAKLLIDSGANLNYFHNSSLVLIYVGSVEVAEEILNSGGDPNAQDSDGATALHYNHSMSEAVAALLIQQGANINAQNNDGETPLHYAAIRGDAEYFKFFLDNGATIGSHDKAGKTPMDYARDNNDKEILRIVEEHASLTRDEEP